MTRNTLSRNPLAPLAIATLAALLAAAPAAAVDGVIEINDARASAGGVTPSDAPGYPVTLDSPGSYRLTGDLVTTASSLHGIEITADHVTIDLNGFSISCAAACGDGGSGNGIEGSGRNHVTVRNGTVRDMGNHGISLQDFAWLVDLRVTGNGEHGISIRDDSRVEGSIVAQNGDDGIHLGTSFDCYLYGNQIQDNAGYGIGIQSMASFIWGHNVLDGNNGAGIGLQVEQSFSAFEIDENYCVVPSCPP